MSSWQYCECDAGLTPSNEELIDGYMICPACGSRVEIVYSEDAVKDLLKQALRDIEELKAR